MFIVLLLLLEIFKASPNLHPYIPELDIVILVVFIPLSAVEEFIVLLLIVEGVYESLNDTIVFNKVKVPDPIKGESTTRDLFKVALPPLFVWLKGEEYNIEFSIIKFEPQQPSLNCESVTKEESILIPLLYESENISEFFIVLLVNVIISDLG